MDIIWTDNQSSCTFWIDWQVLWKLGMEYFVNVIYDVTPSSANPIAIDITLLYIVQISQSQIRCYWLRLRINVMCLSALLTILCHCVRVATYLKLLDHLCIFLLLLFAMAIDPKYTLHFDRRHMPLQFRLSANRLSLELNFSKVTVSITCNWNLILHIRWMYYAASYHVTVDILVSYI